MIDKVSEAHHFVQRYILDVLRRTEFARFRDLRPDGVDSNAFSYHLTALKKQGLVDRTDVGYSLTIKGLAYIDRVSALDTRPRRQPKIMTMTAVINERGEYLVRHKKTQPMINKVTLPAGMLHMDDPSIADAAEREVFEKTGAVIAKPQHVGDYYMAIRHEGEVIMNSLMHTFVVRVNQRDISPNDESFWRMPNDLEDAAPATRRVVKLIESHDSETLFFEEFTEEL